MSETMWRDLAEKALGGRSGERPSLDVLSSHTTEGVSIAPLYPRSVAPGPAALRRTPGPWRVVQSIEHPAPEEANRLALIDLENGADALTLVFAGETARGFGLPLQAAALDQALEAVELDYIALRLDAGAAAPAAAALLATLTRARRLTSAALVVDIGLDPIGSLARTGIAPVALRPDGLRAMLAAGQDAGFAGRTFLADGRPYHEAGAGEAQELAAVLATGVAYLRQLEQAGLELSAASAAIGWLLVADADTFLSIAKFRALRRLWAGVEAAAGLPVRPLYLHAETAWRMMTRHDPWVNVMRATAAVFAAGIGGADAITALPFTSVLGLPEDGARRLARNTQLVLLEEAHLAKVDDPAAGAGGLEALTESLTARAWTLFQAIERQGGIEASLRQGTIQAEIAETAAVRRRTFATLAQGMTGTSSFPVIDEAPSPLAAAARRSAEPRGPLALPAGRDAEPFEALRDRTASLAAAGGRPVIALAVLGTPASHGPRATYAANFFAAAGLPTMECTPERFDRATTSIVCLCGSDETYATELTPSIKSLRTAGASRVLLAGKARQIEGLDPAEAPEVFIHDGCNALQTLEKVIDYLQSDGKVPR